MKPLQFFVTTEEKIQLKTQALENNITLNDLIRLRLGLSEADGPSVADLQSAIDEVQRKGSESTTFNPDDFADPRYEAVEPTA